MWGEYDTYMLVVVGNSFQRVRSSLIAFFNLAIIDRACFQYLFYLRFVDMAAIHTAAGMLAVNNIIGIPVDGICSRLGDVYGNMNLFTPLILFYPKQQ